MMTRIKSVRKRNEREVIFDEGKIADAIFKAAEAVGGEDREMANELAGVVTMFLEQEFTGDTPGIEDIQDTVEKVLIETGHASTAKAYILYRQKQARRRESLQVRKPVRGETLSTDISLMVDPGTRDELLPWDRGRIAKALADEADLDEDLAHDIAHAVERKIFISGINRISTSLIRELVDNELFERGHAAKLEKQQTIGMPKYDMDQLIFSKSKENSNIGANNPEAINLAIAETTLKQYALQEVFSREVADAHLSARVHLHDLGYPTRVYCSSHSLEYIKKYGLELCNLDTCSAPAKHARTLTGHLNTFLASMQAYYAGALGVAYVNILYAPYLEGMDYKTLKQEAQHLIFSGSQSAFSRGGQTLFLDFNIHSGVPRYLKDVPAIGPGGKETGKTYGDYAEVASQFARAMLDVWRAGDQHGHIFAFPKCDFHINDETFTDPDQFELYEYACQVASENGVPYFIFDRDEVTLSACCRLRTTIEDTSMLRHLETMRFCGFQNVTINLPQAAYRAGKGNVDEFLKDVEGGMDIAVQAHMEKRVFIKKLMSAPHMPLWQIGKEAKDGKPYVDLDKATYIIGLVGLNEAVQHLSGEELHESTAALKLGLKIISFMYFKAKQEGKRTGLKMTLEESPAESATRRMAKVDLRNYPAAREVIKGNIERDEFYYTNSIHLRADANIDILTRIRTQAKFHPLIESGAIIHAFVGEELPSTASIMSLVRKTFEQTQAAQLTISPEFTVCRTCHERNTGLQDACTICESDDVFSMTRIVGYYSRISNWNKSKIGELRDRQAGTYALAEAGSVTRRKSAEPATQNATV